MKSKIVSAFSVLSLLALAACGSDADSASPAPAASGTGSADPATLDGIFMTPSGNDATGDGSRANPFASIAKAADVAKTHTGHVFACEGAYAADEAFVPAGVSIHGGFACELGWSKGTARTVLSGKPGKIALRIAGNGESVVEDVDVIAPDATEPGASAIAVFVQNATITFTRSSFTAGAGAKGADAVFSSNTEGPSVASDPLIKGEDGHNACLGGALGNLGAEGRANPFALSAKGGTGGIGLEAKGEKGEDGQILFDAISGLGGAGAGATTCLPGLNGHNGNDGDVGTAAKGNGAISYHGYVGVAGGQGKIGSDGQGGGGGGGAKGKLNCYGASGGGGGAGGKGGLGGEGGRAGGSSFALAVVNAKITFANVVLASAAGGAGGSGAPGANGGVGGYGGAAGGTGGNAGVTVSCNGGDGGAGGKGGEGGGGHGGHSAAIAFVGDKPSEAGLTSKLGAAGIGGGGDVLHGEDGLAAAFVQLEESK